MWSMAQKAIVCESRGWVIFFDYRKRKPANLVEAGGVHRDLHNALVERAQVAAQKAEAWEKANPSHRKAKASSKPSSKL